MTTGSRFFQQVIHQPGGSACDPNLAGFEDSVAHKFYARPLGSGDCSEVEQMLRDLIAGVCTPATASDLTMTKLASRTDAPVGDVVEYTLRITNNGAAPVTNIQITDVIPAVLLAQAPTITNGGILNGSQIEWDVASLAAGETLDFLYETTAVAAGSGVNTVAAVSADDPAQTATATAAVLIVAANVPPVLEGWPDQADTVGVVINLASFGFDADGDTLTFSATGLPAGVQIDPATGALTGTPTTVGTNNVTITVDDGNGGTDSQSFTWTIVAANVPPVLAAIPDQTDPLAQAVNIASSASDGDGDTLTFSATGLPAGVNIDPATGALTGTPTTVGTNNVTITVDDGNGGTDSQSFTWEITAPLVAILDLTKTASATDVSVGDVVDFTLLISNDGAATATATGSVVTDLIPAGMAYVPGSITGAIGPDDSGAPTLSWNIQDLPIGFNTTLSYQAVATAEGVISNTASATSPDDPRPPVTATADVTVGPAAVPFDTNLLNDAQASTVDTAGYWIFTPAEDMTLAAISQWQTGGLFPSTTTRRLLVKSGGTNGTIVGRSEDLTYTLGDGVKTYQFAVPVPNATDVVLTAGTAYHVITADINDALMHGVFGDAIWRTTGLSDANNEVSAGGAGTPDKVVVRVEGTLV